MSVEPCILRVTPEEFARLRERPETLAAYIENGYETGAFAFDWSPAKPLSRMLHLDEFAMWLLTDFDDDTPLCQALIGWDGPQLDEATHGHGAVFYSDPQRVVEIAGALAAMPENHLRERFESRAEDFRRSASGFADDDAILAHQRIHMQRLLEFYRRAAEQGDFILLMLV